MSIFNLLGRYQRKVNMFKILGWFCQCRNTTKPRITQSCSSRATLYICQKGSIIEFYDRTLLYSLINAPITNIRIVVLQTYNVSVLHIIGAMLHLKLSQVISFFVC